MTENVILVDSNDNEIGSEEKVKCHMPDGKLHRAFTALLFDQNGSLVLTRRSKGKMLWPNDWDGTFASHPRQGETYVLSSQRRMPEELGVQCNMDYLFKFEYHVPYKDVGSENEVCGTLMGIIEKNIEFDAIKDEISEIRWVAAEELSADLLKDPQIYCPWMLIALYLLDCSDVQMLQKHNKVIEPWIKPQVRERLAEAIMAHLPESQWRMLEG